MHSPSIDPKVPKLEDFSPSLQSADADKLTSPENSEFTNVASHVPHTSGEKTSIRDKRRASSTPTSIQPLTKVHKRKSKNETVSLSYSTESNVSFSLNDVKSLAVKIVTGSSFHKTHMLNVNGGSRVKKTLLVLVPGLLPTDFETTPNKESPSIVSLDQSKSSDSSLGFVYSHFENLIPTSVPGGDDYIHSPLQALLKGPLTMKAKKKKAKESSQVKLVVNDLLLKKEELERYNYPLHSELEPSEANALPDNWVETKKFKHGGSITFALDCEFCQSATGKVLTRVSVVNFDAEVVYDTYVKPAEPITDYVTRYSGITEELLKNVTTTCKDVQEKILSIISSTDTLIGHSLESDLNVMKIRHPRVIDTSIVYEHHRGPPFRNGLKWLASNYLGRSIQEGEKDGKGHSSVEDSIACLDLIKLKLIKGPNFGTIMEESIVRKVVDVKPDAKVSIVDYTKDEYSSILRDTKPSEVSFSEVQSDESAVKCGISGLEDASLSIVNLRELEINNRTRPIPSNYSGELYVGQDSEKMPLSDKDRDLILKDINDRLKELYEALPKDSVMIISTYGGCTTKMNQLRSIKRTFDKLMKEGVEVNTLSKEETWDYDKLAQLHHATKEARKAVTLVTCKV